MNRNDIYKIRYQIYKDLGYTSEEARKLRSKKLDVSGIKIINGKVDKKRNYNNLVKNTKVDQYTDRARSTENDTVFDNWGMLTHDERYKHDTVDTVNFIKKDLKLTNDQAYYFTYIMVSNGLSYAEAKKQLLSSKEFEMYVSKGAANQPSVKKRGKRK